MAQHPQHPQPTDTELDRIERRIDIDASAERVWALITRPGWWINEGEVDFLAEVRHEDDVDVVTHPKWGEFRIRTVESDEPRYLAYRWIESDTAGTLVEFWIRVRPEGGVTLEVRESGLTELGKTPDELARHYEDNSDGWTTELEAARRFVVAGSSR